ncbi:MAG: (2Fe-2S)-binding protein [Pseudomonadota bacterium]
MIALNVNGKTHQLDVSPDMPLLWAIRDTIGLTGTKYGCGIAQCGACTVHVDGNAVRSCSMPVSAAAGKRITTIENIGDTRVGKVVQSHWERLDVVQCGYCQSGQIMSATALLAKNPQPTDADIDLVMSANVCRCATYVRIRAAIKAASKALA